MSTKLILLLVTLFTSLQSLGAAEPKALAISEEEWMKTVVNKTPPSYPSIARQMKIEGSVTLMVGLDADGNLTEVQPLVGNPILANSAVAAVKRWKFNRYEQAGKPMPVSAKVKFNFHL